MARGYLDERRHEQQENLFSAEGKSMDFAPCEAGAKSMPRATIKSSTYTLIELRWNHRGKSVYIPIPNREPMSFWVPQPSLFDLGTSYFGKICTYKSSKIWFLKISIFPFFKFLFKKMPFLRKLPYFLT